MNATKSTVVQMVAVLEMVGFIKSNGTQSRFVSLLTDTEVKNIRVHSPYKGVRKVSRRMGIINAHYNTSVRRRIAERLGVQLSEVEYENGEVWYKHLMTADNKPLPLVVNKTKNDGKHYLQFFAHKTESKYVMPNGDEVTYRELQPWFYHSKERDDFKPNVIAVNLENVKELRASGVIVEMPGLEEAEAILQS